MSTRRKALLVLAFACAIGHWTHAQETKVLSVDFNLVHGGYTYKCSQDSEFSRIIIKGPPKGDATESYQHEIILQVKATGKLQNATTEELIKLIKYEIDSKSDSATTDELSFFSTCLYASATKQPIKRWSASGYALLMSGHWNQLFISEKK